MKKNNRIVALILTYVLMIGSCGFVFAYESNNRASNDPFALMYDSNEQLIEEISKIPDSEFSVTESDFLMPGEGLRREISEYVLDGNFTAIEGLDLSENMRDVLNNLLEESGENRYIIKYRSGLSRSITSYQGVNSYAKSIGKNTEVITLPGKVNPAEFAANLRAQGFGNEIEYIQPDFKLDINSFEIELDEVTDEEGNEIELEEELLPDTTTQPEITEAPLVTPEPVVEYKQRITGSEPASVTVAVIDSGVDVNHPMLDGYVVDGWDFVEDDDTVYDSDYPLDSSHGTHISGLIAKVAEEYGADVKILPLKVFTNGTAYTSDIIEAISYAEAQGADIINCSFGSTNENPALKEAIEGSSTLYIAAAGNNRRNLDAVPSYPASYELDNIISVGSVNADGGFSYFSNYGIDSVDITALGRDVFSALPNGNDGVQTGTSMSAAYVSGAAAVVKSLGESSVTYEFVPVETEIEIAETITEENNSSIEDETDMSLESEFEVNDEGRADPALGVISDREIEEQPRITTGELKDRLLNSADMLSNLQNKVADGRRINIDNAIANRSGSYKDISPKDDFDVHGYQPTASESWELFTAAGSILQIASGANHNLVLKSDGTVWSWGDNSNGQLGIGSSTYTGGIVQVIGLTNVTAIAACSNNSLALKSDGTIWSWGRNNFYQLGDGTLTDRATPIQISGLTNIEKIECGTYQTMAMDEDGVVYMVGSNRGAFGIGTTNKSNSAPVDIGTYEDTDMSAGWDFTFILDEGEIYAAGINTEGQLGDGTTTTRPTRFKISGISGVKQVSAGAQHALAVKTDGSVYAWGHNEHSKLGNGGTSSVYVPTTINLSGIDYVAALTKHSLAISSSGTVYAWGYNNAGQLGDGTTTKRLSPVLIQGLEDIVMIAGGASHSIAVDSSGTIWVWGDNAMNQLGLDNVNNSNVPVQLVQYASETGNYISFDADSYTVSIPTTGTTTITVSATAYDSEDAEIANAEITYSLVGTYSGVSINSTTGVVTVASTAQPGQVSVVAAYNSITATVAVMLGQGISSEVSLVLTDEAFYDIPIAVSDMPISATPRRFEIDYDSQKLEVEILPSGSLITIISNETDPGEIVFEFTEDTVDSFTGIVGSVRFRAIESGATVIYVKCI